MAKRLGAARQLRIIGGEWRRRQIVFPDHEAIRPTPDRVRETLFNWLQGHIAGARCLEPFAGSGALSFEALSRGAAHCVLLDVNGETTRALEHNFQQLGARNDQYRVIRDDAASWLPDYREAPFDLIFLDPPFASSIDGFLSLAVSAPLLAEDGLVYVETGSPLRTSDLPTGVEITRQKKAGAVHYALLERSASLTL